MPQQTAPVGQNGTLEITVEEKEIRPSSIADVTTKGRQT